jgi:hypothetical protein
MEFLGQERFPQSIKFQGKFLDTEKCISGIDSSMHKGLEVMP